MDQLYYNSRFKDWVDPEFASFNEYGFIEEIQRVKDNTEGVLREELSAEKLSQQIVVPWGDKPTTKITIETGLTHMVLEDMIHYGELSGVFWQMNLDAPYLVLALQAHALN